jgi:formamidopyrimidine-DNA glycosylase
MPELPEVEVVRRELAKLRGGTIVRFESNDARIVDQRIDVVGRVVREVGRRGKWLRIALDRRTRSAERGASGGDSRGHRGAEPLDRGTVLVFSHLGMTGDWSLHAPDEPALRFERVRIDVRRARRITSARYTDARRFGRLVTSATDIDAWRELGPDPLLEGIDERHLLEVMQKRRRTVKEVLMDQSLLAGVGNILAIEALFAARIDPRSPSRSITARDVHAIASALRTIIRRTIAHDEALLEGRRSRSPFRIYGRAKSPCPRCGAALRQVVLGGRTTTFCASCQR